MRKGDGAAVPFFSCVLCFQTGPEGTAFGRLRRYFAASSRVAKTARKQTIMDRFCPSLLQQKVHSIAPAMEAQA